MTKNKGVEFKTFKSYYFINSQNETIIFIWFEDFLQCVKIKHWLQIRNERNFMYFIKERKEFLNKYTTT